MLLFNARLLGFSIAGLAISGVALAQEANVSTGAASAKLGGEFRSELTYTDNGMMKSTGGDDPDSSTTMGVSTANVNLDGKINSDTEYAFRFNLLDPGSAAHPQGPLDYGYGKHWFNKMMGFSIGRQKVLQGGWDNIDNNFKSHAVGVYADNLVFNKYEDLIGVHLNVAGSLTLQLANDRMVGPAKLGRISNASWNESSHPTWILGWAGSFGPIAPIVNIGSYDNNKSHWRDLGIKTDMSGLMASLDVYQNIMTRKVASGTEVEEPQNVATSVTLNVKYLIKGTATPFLYFSTYDNKQADDSKLRLEDSKVNSYEKDAAGNITGMNWDDNGVVWGVGTDLHMMGKGWSPFVAIVGRSGKWADAAGKEETKSDMTIKIGALGDI